MKKFMGLMILFFVIGSMTTANAQLGVKVMGNYSIVYGPAEVASDGAKVDEASFGPGFAAGIFYRAGNESLIGFQGELLYEQRSSKSIKKYEPLGIDFNVANSFSFINLPLLAVINIGNFKPYVGVNIGYMIGANGTFGGTHPAQGKKVNWLGANEGGIFPDYSKDPNFNRFEVGANAGLMLQLSRAFHVDLRISHGITDITNDLHEKYILNLTEIRKDNDYNLSFSLGVGLTF